MRPGAPTMRGEMTALDPVIRAAPVQPYPDCPSSGCSAGTRRVLCGTGMFVAVLRSNDDPDVAP